MAIKTVKIHKLVTLCCKIAGLTLHKLEGVSFRSGDCDTLLQHGRRSRIRLLPSGVDVWACRWQIGLLDR